MKGRTIAAYLCSALSYLLLAVFISGESSLRIDSFGLIHSMSLLYYLAMGFSLTSGFIVMSIRQRKTLLQFANILLVLTALWLVPIVLEGTPRFASTYKSIGFVEYIVREGKLNPQNWELFYHNWPGFSLFAAGLWMAADFTEIDGLALVYPFCLQLLVIIALYWLLRQPARQTGVKNGWYLGGLVYLLANFINQDYFSPQSYSYFILIVFIILLVNQEEWFKDRSSAVACKFVLILLFSAVTISHFLSTLVGFGVLLVFLLREHRRYCLFTLLALMIFAAWTVYGGSEYFEAHFASIAESLFKVQNIWDANVENRVQGNDAHILINRVRIFYTASICLFSLLGLVLSLRKKDCAYKNELVLFLKISVVSGGAAGAFIYGGESFMRAFLLLLMPAAFFSLGYLHLRRFWPLVLLFLFLAVPCHLLAHYGNEEIDYISPGVIRGTRFLACHARGGYVTGFDQILGNYIYTERFVSLPWERFEKHHLTREDSDKYFYAGVGPWEDAYWSLLYNQPDHTLAVTGALKYDRQAQRFYDNGDIRLYYLKSQ